MRKTVFALISMSVIVLAACQKSTPESQVAQPTPEEMAPVSQKIEAQENYCVSCHTDKEQLITTAKPEEVVEAESSGVG